MSATDRGPESERTPIERWWPKLSIGSKHRILEALDEPIDARTADEIASITGRPAPERLTNAEQAYVRTQIEPVD